MGDSGGTQMIDGGGIIDEVVDVKRPRQVGSCATVTTLDFNLKKKLGSHVMQAT